MAETIASLAIRIGADLSGFEKDMKEFNKTWGKVGGQIQQAGTQIGTAFTAAGGAIAAGLGFAVSKAADFDAQMSRVGAIAGATGTDFDALRKTALDLGASTSKSASEVAKGMEEMAAMGFEVNEVISAMPGVISAAEASGSDMAQTAEVMASTLNIFGMEASKATDVADVLAKTANISAANMTDMQYALKYAGPPAAALGISFEELSASIGIMTNAGMKGEQAGTTLRGALLSLLSPSKENSKTMAAMGISITDAQGNFVGLSQLVQNLSASMSGMTETQKAATLAQLVGKEAVSGMLSLMAAGPAEIDKMTAALQNSGGASEEAAKKMKDNLKGSIEQLTGAFETAQISIGTTLTPAIRALSDGLSGLVNWFNNLSPRTQQFIAIGVALTGGLLVLVGAVGFLVAGLGMLAAAQWAAILPMLGFVAAVAAIIAVVGVLAVMIYKNWGDVQTWLMQSWSAITQSAQSVWTAVSTFFTGLWASISTAITSAWTNISNFFIATWNDISNKAVEVWNSVKYVVEFVAGAIAGLFIPSLVKLAVASTVNAAKVVASWLTMQAQALWTATVHAVQVIPSLIASFVQLSIQAAVNAAKTVASWVLIGAQAIAQGAIMATQSALMVAKWVWMGAQSLVQAARMAAAWVIAMGPVAWVTALVVGLAALIIANWDKVREVTKQVWDAVSGFVKNNWLTIANILTAGLAGMVVAVVKNWSDIKQKFIDAWNGIKSWFTGVVTDARGMGVDMMRGMIAGVMSMASSIASAAASVVSSAIDAAKRALKIKSPSRVFMEIGGYTAEGMAVGMEDGTGMIRDAGAFMAGAAMPALNGTAPSSAAPGGTTVVIELDGRVLARSTFEQMGGTLRARGAVT